MGTMSWDLEEFHGKLEFLMDGPSTLGGYCVCQITVIAGASVTLKQRHNAMQKAHYNLSSLARCME